MTKFKVGDRVAVYDHALEGGRSTGVVKSLKCPNGIQKEALYVVGVTRIDHSSCYEFIAHPKQCRRLKPKAPKPAEREPRRIHIYKDALPTSLVGGCEAIVYPGPATKAFAEYYVEFVEVMPAAKKVKS